MACAILLTVLPSRTLLMFGGRFLTEKSGEHESSLINGNTEKKRSTPTLVLLNTGLKSSMLRLFLAFGYNYFNK